MTGLTSYFGAINMETGEYSLANYAIKSYNYKCPCCNQKVILRKGDHNKHHFAHYPTDKECKYYNVLESKEYEYLHEGLTHLSAKWTLKKILESGKEIEIIRRCATGQCDSQTVFVLKENNMDTVYVAEHVMSFENKKIRPDVVRIENYQVKEIYEIHDTNPTKEINRPNDIDWYEFKAEDILNNYNDNFYEKSKKRILFCKRSIIKCNRCIEAEKIELKRRNIQQEINDKIFLEKEEKDKLYNKYLERLNLKIQYSPDNLFFISLKNQLITKKYLSEKQVYYLYKNNNVL